MKQEQVDSIPGIAHPKPLLAGYKGKIGAEFQKKLLKFTNQRFFKLGFRILILQIEELQYEGIAYNLMGSNRFAFQPSGLSPRALVSEGRYLPVQLPDRPSATDGFGLIELPRHVVADCKQPVVMRPRERERGKRGKPRFLQTLSAKCSSAPILQTLSAKSPSTDRTLSSGPGSGVRIPSQTAWSTPRKGAQSERPHKWREVRRAVHVRRFAFLRANT